MDSHHASLMSMYEKLMESLNCGICQDVLKDPRDLSCGHTYCLACLQEYVAIKGWKKTIQCCQCRKETAIPARGQLTGLKQNFKLSCIIDEQATILKQMNSPPAASAEDVAREREPEFQVFVRDLDRKSQTISIRRSDGVGALKQRVEKKTGIPANSQRLIFRGRQLDGDQTLGEFGLELHSTIEMVLTLKGGIAF